MEKYILSNIPESVPNWNTALGRQWHWAQIGIQIIKDEHHFRLNDKDSNQQ